MENIDVHRTVADVYAADIGGEPAAAGTGRLFLFSIEADPEPDVLARTANILNLANVAPRRVHFERQTGGNVVMSIAIWLGSDIKADMIRRKLEQLTCTISVVVTCRAE